MRWCSLKDWGIYVCITHAHYCNDPQKSLYCSPFPIGHIATQSGLWLAILILPNLIPPLFPCKQTYIPAPFTSHWRWRQQLLVHSHTVSWPRRWHFVPWELREFQISFLQNYYYKVVLYKLLTVIIERTAVTASSVCLPTSGNGNCFCFSLTHSLWMAASTEDRLQHCTLVIKIFDLYMTAS